MMIVHGIDLAAAAAELALIGGVYDAATRCKVGVLVTRTYDGSLVDAYVCDDVPVGQIADVVLDGRRRAAVHVDAQVAA